MPPFLLAHLSDVHLGPLPRLGLGHANLKRVLGLLNWVKNRRRVHLPETLARIVADMKAQAPDHIAVTGDLANIGLPEEYANAAGWLAALGDPERVSAIPGNHDIYTRLRGHPGVGLWQPWMSSFGDGPPSLSDTGFPYVRRIGGVGLVGLCSAIETRPFYAGGALGETQRMRLAAMLESLGAEGLVRVVLIHHPPLPGLAKPAKALEDAAELSAVLAAKGAELVLHGHNHVAMLNCVGGPQGPVPVVGVPSASLGRPFKSDMLAQYNLYRLQRGAAGTAIEMITRGLAVPDGPVVELGRRRLLPAAGSTA